MEYNNKKYNQEIAYKKIENKVYSSSSYYKFLFNISKLDKFREIFTFDGKFDANISNEVMNNLDLLRYICNGETGMNLEKEFHDTLVSAAKEEDAISSVINTYLIEIKYGNPYRVELNDYTTNDKLFSILESIFGLDTLILSVNNKGILLDRFNNIMETNDLEEANRFIEIIENLYNSITKEKHPESAQQIIESYKDVLKPYISAGFQKQLNEISNNKHQNFKSFDILYKKVTEDILKIDKDKKM